MSQTGEPQGEPVKVGIGNADLITGLYAGFAILSALRHRDRTGHPNIVPYQVFRTADGYLILAVGNDGQFAKFCEFAGCPELAADQRFTTNPARLKHRDELIPLIADIVVRQPRAQWRDGLESCGVPAGPVNTLPETFEDPQVKARGVVHADHLYRDAVPLLNSPIHMSETPPQVRLAPPVLGQHTRSILDEILGLDGQTVDTLITNECIGDSRFFIDLAHVETQAAVLMVAQAIEIVDAGQPCGTEANTAKLLASEASWHAAFLPLKKGRASPGQAAVG